MWILATIAGIAAALAGSIYIWKNAIKPVSKFITSLDTMIPLMKELNDTFKNTPNAFDVLDEIVAEFRTDSGSSLKDSINRLEGYAAENRNAAQVAAKVADLVRVSMEASVKLDQRDRDELRDMLLRLDRVAKAVDDGVATGLRSEAAAIKVAMDLSESHDRASKAPSNDPGSAADAAVLPENR